MHVTFISITYDFQWYENATVELLILHWFFSCEVCVITFKKQVRPQGHNKAKWYSVTQCYKVIIPRSHDRHRFISTGAWKMFGRRFVTLIYTPHLEQPQFILIWSIIPKCMSAAGMLKSENVFSCLINSHLAAFSCHIWMATFLQLGLHIFLVNKIA